MTAKINPSRQESPLRLLVEVGDGRTAGAILENGFLRYCRDFGAQCHVVSPGARFEPFVSRYSLPETQFTYLSVDTLNQARFGRLRSREARFGRWLCRRGMGKARRILWRLVGEPLTALDGQPLKNLVETERPHCVVSTNLNLGFGRGLMAMGRRKGIPTVGNVFSWDHPYYDQQSRPDLLTCWSPIVRDGLVSLGGFLPKQVEVIGAPVFDPYFDPTGVWTRKELCDHLGLQPNRPIILFATLGQMRIFWDETGTFRSFLEAMDREGLPGPPQIVLRLHPLSVDHYFQEFRSRSDVVFSRYLGYCPGIRVWPRRDEVILAGNLLRHADVCVSPGSTMTVEAAIFDKPTVVPTFNPTFPEEYAKFFHQNWLNKHLGVLMQEDGFCLAESPNDAVSAVRRALADPSWLAEGRRFVRDNLLGPLDGQSTRRLAQAAVDHARRSMADGSGAVSNIQRVGPDHQRPSLIGSKQSDFSRN